MPVSVHSFLKITACVALVALSTGCLSRRAFWHGIMDKGAGTLTVSGQYQKEGLKPPVVLTAQQITNTVVGTETNGSICVAYGQDLKPQAALLARAVEKTFSETEKTLETALPVRPHIYLLRMPNEQHAIQFSMSIPETHRTMPWLMVLTNLPPKSAGASAVPTEALWADLREAPTQIFLMAHESLEMHLIDPKELLVMGDISANKGFIHIQFKHHTRWFREGLANYAGTKAAQSFRRYLASAGTDPAVLRFTEKSMQPLSELAKAGEKLFDWNQNSPTDYYAAATGLFLLIEERQGPGAVSHIIHQLPTVKFPDGKSLLKLIRQKTGLDLRELVRTFQFPDLGFETHPDAQGRPEIESVAAGRWAAGANLVKGDVLLEANGSPLGGIGDFELQVLRALDRDRKLSLAFSRNGERHVTGALALPIGSVP